MQNLVDEVFSTIQSSRITNVKDSMEELVAILKSDTFLLEEVEKKLTKQDILWFNRNNSCLFFEIPNDCSYGYKNQKMNMDDEVSWFLSEINETEQINWENLRYRYKRALKLLGTKDVIYYNNIREIVLMQHEDKWRYLNE